MKKKSIGEILVELRGLTSEQYEEIKEQSKQQQKYIEDFIRDNQVVSEELLAKAYADKFAVPYIEVITEKMADTDLLGRIPLKYLREYGIIPVRSGEDVVILTFNPYNVQPVDEIRMLLDMDVKLAIAPRSRIIEAINRYYPIEGTSEVMQELEEEEEIAEAVDFGAIEEEDIISMASEAPIIKLVNHILYQAVKRNASDIHIEPFEKELRVRYRIDGVLHSVMTPPKRVQAALVSRIKIMANLNIAEKRQPQDGRIQVRVSDRQIDIRVSVLPVANGERIVMRLLDKSKTFKKVKDLSLSSRDYRVVRDSMAQPNGIMLITGPTGSGKTSTLYSILSELNESDVNIITVEDPVEYQLKGISQVQVREKVGLTFATALRSILRQDPDIVMIGETRDQETAQIAVQAALTGHLVLSTLHTNSAAGAITRLIDMGVEEYLIASTVVSVMAQRLVRRLCEACKKEYEPDMDALRRLGMSQKEAQGVTFYKATGCDECMQTGYSGRIAIFEVMVMTEAVRKLTIESADTNIIQQQARKEGMTLLIEDGVRKIKQGLTTVEEVLSVAVAQESLEEELGEAIARDMDQNQ